MRKTIMTVNNSNIWKKGDVMFIDQPPKMFGNTVRVYPSKEMKKLNPIHFENTYYYAFKKEIRDLTGIEKIKYLFKTQ